MPHIPIADLYGIFGFPVSSTIDEPALVRQVRALASPIEAATIVTALVALAIFAVPLLRGLA